IPTTLLSMTDASVGGKTGINLGHVKNAVGTFADPLAIMIHPGFLTTLHPDELRSGFAEMLKHGLIASADHWHQVCSAMVHGELNDELVLESAMIKWHIAEKDPEEKAGRRLLNFGHTFGHALESVMLENRSPVTHGDAVAAGMVAEVILSRMKGLLPDPQAEVIVADLLRLFPIQELFAIDFERLWSYMVHDKKAVHGIQKITLLRGAGHALHGQACTVPEISAAWENARNLVNG
ncbi:MAG: 3-dehydroquinate synthase, partial [Flavobacteriales bacterium]|nr:3-dehydroquinate synthase [Flavobacteriales bacterium]